MEIRTTLPIYFENRTLTRTIVYYFQESVGFIVGKFSPGSLACSKIK